MQNDLIAWALEELLRIFEITRQTDPFYESIMYTLAI